VPHFFSRRSLVQAFEEKVKGKRLICYDSVPWPAKGGSVEFLIGLFPSAFKCVTWPIDTLDYVRLFGVGFVLVALN